MAWRTGDGAVGTAFASEVDDPFAVIANDRPSTRTMNAVRRMRGSAENPEPLQCRAARLNFRVPVKVRLRPITGTLLKSGAQTPVRP